MDRRLKRRELVLVAAEFLAEEAKRHVPVGHRRSFEKALEDAEGAADIFARAMGENPDLAKPVLIEAARKAGSAPKMDALGKLIEELAQPIGRASRCRN